MTLGRTGRPEAPAPPIPTGFSLHRNPTPARVCSPPFPSGPHCPRPQVFKVRPSRSEVCFALKVIRNLDSLSKQAETEVGILNRLRMPGEGANGLAGDKSEGGTDPRSLVVQLHQHFRYKDHTCLVFEALGVNLLQLLQQNGCRGLSLSLVRFFAKQLLQVLVLLRHEGILHCDLKPENILLRNLQSPAIKIIDFGSACYAAQQPSSTYIQSRFYRSPEVLLGHPYGVEIDTWSLGCIVGEFFLGLPLFPGESEYNQVPVPSFTIQGSTHCSWAMGER